MTPQEVLEILHVAERLKCNTRHCDTSTGRRESVAEHSWRLCLFAMLLEQEPEFQALDMGRVLRMCLIHDLGEAFRGIFPPFPSRPRTRGGSRGCMKIGLPSSRPPTVPSSRRCWQR